MTTQHYIFSEVDEEARYTTPVESWDTWYDSLPRVQNTVSYTEFNENKEINIEFKYIPSIDTRTTLKGLKFKWDPRRMIWVRKLNAYGRKAVQKLLKELNAQAI